MLAQAPRRSAAAAPQAGPLGGRAQRARGAGCCGGARAPERAARRALERAVVDHDAVGAQDDVECGQRLRVLAVTLARRVPVRQHAQPPLRGHLRRPNERAWGGAWRHRGSAQLGSSARTQPCSSSTTLGITGTYWGHAGVSLSQHASCCQTGRIPAAGAGQAGNMTWPLHGSRSAPAGGHGSTRACCARIRRRATGSAHRAAGSGHWARWHRATGRGQRARARSCSSCAHCARIVLGSTTSVPPCGMRAGSPAAPPGAPASAQPSPPPPPVGPEPGPAASPAAACSGASSAAAGGASGGGASAQAPAAGCAAARPRRRASRSLRMSAIMLTVLPRPCARRPACLRLAPLQATGEGPPCASHGRRRARRQQRSVLPSQLRRNDALGGIYHANNCAAVNKCPAQLTVP